MTRKMPYVAHVMLAGPDSRPDDSPNKRRQLIETIAFAVHCTTTDAALMLFWLERIVVSARLREYRIIFPRSAELNAQYLLFAKIFRPNSIDAPNKLMQQITQYLLDPGRNETAIQHTQISRRFVYGQIAIAIRRKSLLSPLVPIVESGPTHQQART